MKKLILVLLVALLAMPAMAAVNVIAVNGSTEKTVDIWVECTDAEVSNGQSLLAGLAIDVVLSGGAEVTSVTGYKTDGESTSGSPGYGVYMEVDQVKDPCGVYGWRTGVGDPVADPCDAPSDTLTGVGGITLEFGALYADPCDNMVNAPDPCMLICTIGIDCTEATELDLVANATRGGPVLKGGAAPSSVSMTQDLAISGCDECFPTDGVGGQAAYDNWVYFGKPDCWCNPFQCDGDIDGALQGNSKAGYYAVGTGDISVLLAAWEVIEPPFGTGLGTTEALGTLRACADLDHLLQGNSKAGYYAVGTSDITILLAGWEVIEPPFGTGLPSDCPR